MSTTHIPPTDRPRAHNQALGALGEAYAEQFLLERGFRLLAKNWRCRYGELDLIMREKDTVVAVEVKTRSGSGYGSPLEAITADKAARLRRLLIAWARDHGMRGAKLRVDGIGIHLAPRATQPRIEHLRSIS